MALSGTAAALDNTTAGQALSHANSHRAELRAADGDAFSIRDTFVDPVKGVTVARVERTYRGLPVIGGDAVQRFRGNSFQGLSQTLRTDVRPDVRPTITADRAIVEAGVRFGTDFDGVPTARLVVYALRSTPTLAYEVVYSGTRADQTPTDMHYFVSARDGRVLDQWDNIHTATATGTARTLYVGNVPVTTNSITGGFELRDPTRGGTYTINGHTGRTSGMIFTDTDNTWGNNTNADAASAAAEVHYGVGVTWDFYKNVLGRLGIANNGKGSYNRVHYGVNYGNAFWNDGCFCMTFGDGDGVNLGPLVNIDVAGHELSHGVTSRTAGLVYSGESGGLNESTSDIFGTMVEFYANNAADTPDYLIGEELFLANTPGSANQKALRYMFDPIRDTRSPNCYVATLGNLDVHFSSGVGNRFFYLLAEGSGARTYSGVNHQVATCNAGSVTGIGRDKAAKIWYRALSMYMTSGTNYAGAAVATISAASDLYGPASPERASVIAAWRAVSVPTP
jgi:Zn-dependent metalloprotease